MSGFSRAFTVRPKQTIAAGVGLSVALLASMGYCGAQLNAGPEEAPQVQAGAPQQGDPGVDGLGQIRSGSLEASNVNIVEELVDMIETQRAYEVNSKMIKATDEMLQYANQQL